MNWVRSAGTGSSSREPAAVGQAHDDDMMSVEGNARRAVGRIQEKLRNSRRKRSSARFRDWERGNFVRRSEAANGLPLSCRLQVPDLRHRFLLDEQALS